MAVAAAFAYKWQSPPISLSLGGSLAFFLAGFLLADFFLMSPPTAPRRRSWDLVSAVGWPALAALLVSASQYTPLVLPFLIVLLYGAAFYGRASSAAFSSLWADVTGGMCYSIYLLHNYLIAFTGLTTERLGMGWSFEARLLLQLLLIAPIVLIVSAVYYRVIEQPCMQPGWPGLTSAIYSRAVRAAAA